MSLGAGTVRHGANHGRTGGQMAGAGDVAADLERGLSALPVELVGSAQQLLGEAIEILAPVAASSTQADLHQAAAGLQHALGELERVQAALIAIRSAVQGLITALIGAGGGTGPAIPANLPAKINTSAAKPDAISPSDKRAADLMAKLPVRTGESGQKTSGYWIDEDGTEYGPLISGQDQDYEHARATLRDLEIGPAHGDLFAASHVETKFAARMRGSQRKRIILVINNQPCDDGRYSCDRLLPKILKPDQEVTVYWPGGKGIYRGRRP